MPSYQVTTGIMDLGTLASGSCIAALSNPTSSGRTILIERSTLRTAFSGTPAATGITFGVTRATGTAAGGTASKSGATVARNRPGVANPVALWRYGPAAVTGMTDDGVGDFKTAHLAHQNGTMAEFELIENIENIEDGDPIAIAPGTSLIVRTREISVAGSRVSIDIEFTEVAW